MSSPSPNHRWYVVGLTLVNQALIVGILVYSFALFVVPWLEEFEISRGSMMMSIFLFQVFTGLASPVVGRLLDTDMLRRLVLLGAVFLTGGLALLSQVTAFWQILVLYCTVLPIAMVLCGTLASQTMVSKWFRKGRGLAIGISAMGTSIGGFIFPLVTAELIVAISWQSSLLVLAAVAFLLMVPLNFIILRHSPPPPDLSSDGGNTHLDARIWTTREILSTRSFWIPVMGFIPVNAAFSGVQFNIGAYASDLGYDQGMAAQLISVTSITMIIGKFVYGGLGDRVDHRKLYWMMAVCMVGSLLLFAGEPDRIGLFGAAILQGFATGGIMPMMGVMYAARFGTLSFGRVLGFVNMFLMVGGFGSIMSGYIFDMTQSYDYAFWFFASLLLPCSIAMIWLPQPEKQQ